MATQEQVNAACEAIEARGERATVDRVRAELGGGSPNSLTPMVRQWRAGQGTRRTESPAPVAPIEPGALPAAVQRVMDALTAGVAALGPAFGQAAAEVAETERRRSRLEVEAAAAGARAQVEEFRLAAEDERAATESVRAEVLELEAAIGAKDTEIQQLAASLADRSAEIDRLTGRIEREQDARAAVEARAAELEEAVQTARNAAATAQGAALAAEAETQRQRDLVTGTLAKLEASQATVAELRTEGAVARQSADSERQRAERAEAERTEAALAARDAIGRAAKAEGALAALRAEPGG